MYDEVACFPVSEICRLRSSRILSSCAPPLPLPYPCVRPENLSLMQDLFQRLHDKAIRETGGSVECAKMLMGRGSAATTGVEGFYSIADGVQIMHMFLLRPEGPGDVAAMLLFCIVSGENQVGLHALISVRGRETALSYPATHNSKKPYLPISYCKAHICRSPCTFRSRV